LQIISEAYSAGKYVVECDGVRGKTYQIQIVDPDSMILSADDAELMRKPDLGPVLRVTFGAEPNGRKTITVRLKAT
jgi:hypothetical protein